MTSPATQEPCPKCGGSRIIPGSIPALDKQCDCPAPPSQRAELLTREQTAQLDDLMERMKHCSRGNTSYPWLQVTRNEAAALLQHIAALTQRVEALSARIEETEPGAECWNALSACGRMKLMGATMAADHIGMEFWIHHDAKGDAQDLEGRDWFCRFMMKAVDAYRALSQEPRNG